ncbi:DUF742 domain-containing protein [Jiangella gansuensis]|uniref:DUF742 domain-containing protein n=1 Tax=Jiangella gansuensis TaxID=281473 RepID=UPI00047E035E|nr:DUF742 domain-containing protein [Jiangella gansuensis]
MAAPDGRRVRPYLATRGRTRPVQDIAIEALVSTTQDGRIRGADPEPERERILRLCHSPRSVAEVAAIVSTPLGVARVLVADLETEGLVRVADPHAAFAGSAEPARNLSVLERVRDGLRRL